VTYRRVTFRLKDDPVSFELRTYSEEEWVERKPLIDAMAVGVKRAKGTVTVTTAHETEESL
jgi:hypothetical protein